MELHDSSGCAPSRIHEHFFDKNALVITCKTEIGLSVDGLTESAPNAFEFAYKGTIWLYRPVVGIHLQFGRLRNLLELYRRLVLCTELSKKLPRMKIPGKTVHRKNV